MAFNKEDFEIFHDLKCDIQPVGIKYHSMIPEGMNRSTQKMALCEMLKTAQGGEVFYADAENHTCEVGPHILGHKEPEEHFIDGEFGAGLQAYKDTRAASNIYKHIPIMEKGSIICIAFAPLDKLLFEPDVMIFLADINQTWILMRALSYETGEPWQSRSSTVIGCSWVFVHPHLSREANHIPSGLGFGMKRRKLFPENRHFVSIPLNKLPSVIRSLREMPWTPEAFKLGGQKYVKQLREKLGLP